MLTNEWKKSTRSNGTGGSNCVEVMARDGILGMDKEIRVRDSKENGSGIQSTLTFSVAEWEAFVIGVKNGEFDI